MMKRLGATALLAFGFSSAALAATFNTGQVAVGPNFSGGTGPFEQNTNGQVIDISGSATGGFSSFGSGTLHVEPGIIKLQGDATGSLNTVTRGILRDNITYFAAAPTGTFAMVPLTVVVNGNFTVNANGVTAGGWLLQAAEGSSLFAINKSGTLFGGGPFALKHGYVGDAFGTFTTLVSVQIGMPALIDIELSGSAQASYSFDPGLPSASFDLAHSLYWGGVDELLINGVSVPFTMSSESGTDYRNSFAPSAVPEPDSAVLLAVGLALFGLRWARRDSRRGSGAALQRR